MKTTLNVILGKVLASGLMAIFIQTIMKFSKVEKLTELIVTLFCFVLFYLVLSDIWGALE